MKRKIKKGIAYFMGWLFCHTEEEVKPSDTYPNDLELTEMFWKGYHDKRELERQGILTNFYRAIRTLVFGITFLTVLHVIEPLNLGLVATLSIPALSGIILSLIIIKVKS